MRTRIFIDGRYAWSDNEPSCPNSPKGWFMGSMVTGAPGPVERQRIASRENSAAVRERLAAGDPPPEPRKRADRTRFYPTDEERLAARARTFREAKRRARQRQAESRAALRSEVQSMRLERAS